MNNSLLLTLFAGLLLFSCGTETPTEKPEENNGIQMTVDLDSLSESELVSRIETMESKLMDEESLEMSKANSIELLEAAQKHIARFPNSEKRRAILRKASQAAQGLNKPYEAIRLLDIAIAENAMDTTIYEEMNNQAFLYDQMGNKTRAKEMYRKLISDFPNNPYIESQKGMLTIIDLDPDELNEWLEKQHAK